MRYDARSLIDFALNSRFSILNYFALLILAFSSVDVRAADKPNIILIYTDDQAYKMTGFEGNEEVKTPHLDRLAGESVQFTHCYVPTPQCAPCRGAVLTGLYPHAHGVTTNGPSMDPMTDVFTRRLKRAGYTCGLVGKWHLGNRKNIPDFGLIDLDASHPAPTSSQAASKPTSRLASSRPARVISQAASKPTSRLASSRPAHSSGYHTDVQTDHAIEFIEKSHNKPFFLWVCYNAPHEPLVYPPGMESAYPPASLHLPTTMNVSTALWPQKLQQSPPALRFKQANERAILEARSKYYAMIARIDDNVGRLLKRLDELKLRDNTMVVFTSDNGWTIGDHALFSKGPAFFDELIRMPLLMRYPPLTKSAAKIDCVVSNVDFAPTFLDLAEVPAPPSFQGSSLLPLIRDPSGARHPDECFLEYHMQPNKGNNKTDYEASVRGIVTGRYKYLDYLDDANDLCFDLKRDPMETENIIKDAEYIPVIKVLKDRVNGWRKETRDPVPVTN